LFYERRSGNFTKYYFEGFNNIDFKINYLKVPFIINYSFLINKNQSVVLGAGFYSLIGLNGKEEYAYYDFYAGTHIGTRDINFNSDYNKNDFGSEFSISYQYKAYSLDFSYDIGFKNVFYNQVVSTKYRTINLGIAYRLTK